MLFLYIYFGIGAYTYGLFGLIYRRVMKLNAMPVYLAAWPLIILILVFWRDMIPEVWE